MTSNITPNSKGKDEVRDLSFLPVLTHIMATPENPFFASENGVLFNKNKTVLIRYPEGRQGSYIIPRLVIAIGHKAFDNCTGLSAVTIPDSVVEVGYCAFHEKEKVTKKHPLNNLIWLQ